MQISQKNGTSFTFFPILLKRTGKNVSFFWVSKVEKNTKQERERTERSLKERERPEHSERKRTRCPTLKSMNTLGKSMNTLGKRMTILGKSMNNLGKSLNTLGKSMTSGTLQEELFTRFLIWIWELKVGLLDVYGVIYTYFNTKHQITTSTLKNLNF